MTNIRPEQGDDYLSVERVNQLAFGQEGAARLVAALRETDGHDPALSLVAIRNNRVVGHILFSPIVIETDGDDAAALALAPMAVLPNHQRQGIGSELVRSGLEACRLRAGFLPNESVRRPCRVADHLPTVGSVLQIYPDSHL